MSAIDVAAGRARRTEPIRRTGALGTKENVGVRICLVSKDGPVIDPCERYRRCGGLWDLLN